MTTGSPGVAAFLSQVAFWTLIVYGFAVGVLTGISGFIAAWLGGRFGVALPALRCCDALIVRGGVGQCAGCRHLQR
jgi:hypothetical protein